MNAERVVQRVWFGDGVVPAVARAALWPASLVFGSAVRARSLLYDAKILEQRAAALPTVSVGNLTVGGTGKTPVSSWLAARLAERANPAIVLRGYGGDEIDVHRRLNPRVTVIANADREAAIVDAGLAGADVVVLDDAFQHRRVTRTADVVLLSVEQLMRPRRMLPAGPWREPLSAARRADLVILTRKSATPDDARWAEHAVQVTLGNVPTAIVHLAPDAIVDVADDTVRRPLADISGKRVLGIAAIGEPESFRRQLELLGAEVSLAAFPDHHAFTSDEIAALAARVPADGLVLCTLKDGVKLAARWPGPNRLWYVSQQLKVELGREEIDRLLQRVLDARTSTSNVPG
jgi:tetraacyldisaccharide 4'-kinase